MKVELNLTERLFASLVGVRTTLMRPPYAMDEEPDTADQVRPLEIPQEMGYITVGNRIDPNDWSENPSAEQISAYVLSHLPPCRQEDLRCGNIVLLHDGGGDRAETVRALPMIIDGIRARGYEIAPVYELLGKTRADVMSPLPPAEQWAARLDRFGFWLFEAGIVAITWIFLIGDLLMTGRLIFIGAAAVYDRVHEKIFGKPAEVASYKPKVAVLIPAYNEEKVIERTVRAALNSNYPNLRVIVIDDGSKDRTLEVARNAFAEEAAAGKVLILGKKNSGKAEALNYGIEHIGDAELFVGIDADTIIAPDAISRLVPHFINPEGRSDCGKCEGWQPGESVDALAGAGIHHQSELRTARARRSGRGERGAGCDRGVAGFRGTRSRRIPRGHGRRRRRPDDGVAAPRISRRIRGHGARLHRSAYECEWADAAAVPVVLRNLAGGV